MAAHRRRRKRPRTSSASKCMPATASTTTMAATISRPSARSSSSISAIILMGEAIFVGLGESVRRMRASMDGPARRCGKATRQQRRAVAHDDHRARQRHHRHQARRAHHRALRRPLPLPRVHRHRAAQSPTAAPTRAASYAKRFAAKEACAKALGHRLPPRRVLARHGGRQSALGPAHPGADRRGAAGACRSSRRRVTTCASTSPSPTTFPLAQAIVIISAFRVPMRD